MSNAGIAYRLRGFLIAAPLILALFSVCYETENDWLIWPVGVLVFVSGLLLRIWAQQHLHYRLKIRKTLTTTGPYSFVRNPIYLGNILICLGLVTVSELLWFVPIALLYCFSVYSLVVSYEERHLLDKYGESYRQYLSQVPRWIPRRTCCQNLGFTNEYLRQSVKVEIHFILLVLPFVVKEFVAP